MKIEAIPLTGARGGRLPDFTALAKPRLNMLVVMTAAAGYYLGAGDGVSPVGLLATVVGTFLVAGGASAVNQWMERDVDALMQRTRLRPLPDGRMQPGEALVFAAWISAAGLLVLALGANPLAAAVAFTTLVTYAALYTPLKRRTSFSTVVGAVPGALPALLGWAAATNGLSREGWVLFAIVFLWQMPHFLSIAWLYRDDYARAGFPMLPVIEPDGRSTAQQVVAYGSALVPMSLLPSGLGMAGAWYFAGALVLGGVFLALGIDFARRRHRREARRLFFASILYLPLLWVLLIANSL